MFMFHKEAVLAGPQGNADVGLAGKSCCSNQWPLVLCWQKHTGSRDEFLVIANDKRDVCDKVQLKYSPLCGVITSTLLLWCRSHFACVRPWDQAYFTQDAGTDLRTDSLYIL